MRGRYATVFAIIGLAACSGWGSEPDPNVVHVTNLQYADMAACGPSTCDGKVYFQLLNSENQGRMGLVMVFVHNLAGGGWGVNVGPDGWGAVPVKLDRAARPYQITACPGGVQEGSRACATASTG